MIVEQLKRSILSSAFRGKLINSSNIINEYNEETRRKELENIQKQSKITIKKFDPVIHDNEIPYSIPDNWKWVRLGALTYNWGQKTPDSDFEYIDISSIDNINQKLSENSNVIKCSNAPSRARKIINKGDIIYSTVRPYLHNIAIIDKTFEKEPIASTGFAVLHTLQFLNNKYLFYYLISPEFDMYANSSENAVGIAYPAINDEKLYNGLVPLPPIEEQQRIVCAIEKLFEQINIVKPIETELTELKNNFPIDMKNSLLESAIKGNLTLNNINELPVLDVKNYSYEDLFDIPSNWRWCKIDDVIDIQTGLAFKKTEQCKENANALRVLRGGNINNNYQYLLKDDDVYVNYTDKYIRLLEGDVITPSVTSMEQMGKTGYIDKNLDKITAGGFVYIMRTKNEKILLPKYMMYFINSKFHKNMCKPNIHKSGQAFYNLKKSGLILQPIPLPPIEEQQRIVDKLEQLLPLCNDIDNLIKSE